MASKTEDDPPADGLGPETEAPRPNPRMQLFPTGKQDDDIEAPKGNPDDETEAPKGKPDDETEAPKGKPDKDIESQNPPDVTDDTENNNRDWRNLKQLGPNLKSLPRDFCPCCFGPQPRSRKVAYFLFSCCTGTQERRNNNVNTCVGLCIGTLYTVLAGGLLMVFMYLILKACKVIPEDVVAPGGGDNGTTGGNGTMNGNFIS